MPLVEWAIRQQKVIKGGKRNEEKGDYLDDESTLSFESF
jgi:hypothetical protein